MARPWVFPVALDPGSELPIFLQISRAISSDIRRGRLRPGAVLPGSRSLARSLDVHRNTVLASYRELKDGGWVISAQRSLRVSEAIPAQALRAPPRTRAKGTTGFDLVPSRLEPDMPMPDARSRLPDGGFPDLRLVPVDLLARAFRRALRAKTKSPLGYGTGRGSVELRQALAALLSEMRGLACDEDDVLITSGSQMALDLVARALVRPGDVVAVENPGYPVAWDTLRLAGAELVPIDVDRDGLRVDQLSALAATRPLRAVYTTPHHQFPTTVSLSPARRIELLDLARPRRIAIIEDDFDFEFHYASRPLLPLASADDAGVVIYLGTLSKILAPGVRLGFATGPRPLLDELAARRARLDRGNPAMERAIAELLDDGLVRRHARKMRRLYEARRDALSEALERELGRVLSFDVPAGGMSLWLTVDPKVDVEAWQQRAHAKGTAFITGRTFDFHGRPRPTIRMGFTALDERELRDTVRRMRAVL
ncbi:PLP-dependent aminotransferase family protein [Pendulispora rubella]|uniref:PLP-dependent aminotransferase family protein n=1 Tax=Pendulispora rubella TaxID=2741070 RepID=A0ABZ2L821_9BACT